MMRVLMPFWASARASVRPAGPAPACRVSSEPHGGNMYPSTHYEDGYGNLHAHCCGGPIGAVSSDVCALLYPTHTVPPSDLYACCQIDRSGELEQDSTFLSMPTLRVMRWRGGPAAARRAALTLCRTVPATAYAAEADVACTVSFASSSGGRVLHSHERRGPTWSR